MRLIPFNLLRELAAAFALSGALGAASAQESTEELILNTSVGNRAPVPVLVWRRGNEYFVPYSQATALDLPNALQKEVPGLPEAVIADTQVETSDSDELRLRVPLVYFKNQFFDLNAPPPGTRLEAIPAVWVRYDLYAQKSSGLRPVGGTLDLVTAYQNWALKNTWQLPRDMEQAPVTRAYTSLESDRGNHKISIGDASVAEGLPVFTTRQGLGLHLSGKLGERVAAEVRVSGHVPDDGILKVYANQQELFRATARAGTYEVRGLPTLPGEAKYTVFFDDGSSVRLLNSLDTFESVGLYKEGTGAYSLFVGAPRDTEGGRVQSGYKKELLTEASLGYGVSKYHSAQFTLLSQKAESWAGGGLKSEWGSSVFSEAGAYWVKGPAYSGVTTELSAHYSTQAFRVGAAHVRFSDVRGTPVDGFLAESKVFAGWGGWNVYWLKSRYVADSMPGSFYTLGLSKAFNFGPASLTVTAARTTRDGIAASPYLAVLFNYALDRDTYVGGTVTKKHVEVTADKRVANWGLSSRVTHDAGRFEGSLGGFYQGAYGTAFGTWERELRSSILGLNGGAVLYGWDGGVAMQSTANRPGDSLLVVDAGAPNVDVVVESRNRFATNTEGRVAVPLRSHVPQRIELDLKTLPVDKTIDTAQLIAETKPYEALALKFDTREAGYAVYLTLSDGSAVPEGSVAFLSTGPIPVVGRGMVWLEKAQDKFKVQVGEQTYCSVEGANRRGNLVCM